MSGLLVITPTLGVSQWLEETVGSVARMPFTCRHVLVCPASARADLAGRFSGTLVVSEPGGGMYAALNAGLAATNDWDAFTYINDDDLLLPRFAAVAQLVASAAGRALIAYGGVNLIDACGRRLGAVPVSPWPSLNRSLYGLRLEPVYQHGTVISRAALSALGGFDASLRFCGDSELLARACVTGVPFACAGVAPVAAFRLRPGQLTKNRPDMIEERTRVDRKLGLIPPRVALRHRWARLAFRAANLPVYAERIARHGFLSFDDLLERAG